MNRRAITLAILPLENLSTFEDDSRLARGFVHDLISELARFPALGVIAADSVFSPHHAGKGSIGIGQDLGAGHLLRGSIRRMGDHLRISLQLIETETAAHLWAGRFDEQDLPGIPDEVAARVANALTIRLDQSLLAGARARPPSKLQAYECWLRGMECLQRGTVEADQEGRQFFEQALQVDPHYARAYAGISLSHFNEWSCQAWEHWETKERLAYDFALKAEHLDPDDATVQLILGRIEQYRRQFETAGLRLDRAQSLAPSDARILVQLACYFAYQGEGERGWECAQRGLELNPMGPPWRYAYASFPLFVLGRYAEFLEMLGKSPCDFVVDLPVFQAVACAYLGDKIRAAERLALFLEMFTERICEGRPQDSETVLQWLLQVNPYRRKADLARLEEGLRRAGLHGSGVPVADAPRPAISGNVFRKQGDVWNLSFGGQTLQMPAMRGFDDIARMLARPNEDLHCADLADVKVQSAGMEVADARSLQAYRLRLAELDSGLADAIAAEDDHLAEKLEAEREAVLREVGRAAGIGGRKRTSGGANERARSAVTWRIRHAIRKIGKLHPPLGRHLERSLRTGTFCNYRPEQPMDWQL